MRQKLTIVVLLIIINQLPLSAQDIEINIPDSLFILEEELTDEIIDPVPNVKYPIFPGGQDSLWCFVESEFNNNIIDQYDSTKLVFVIFKIDTLGRMMDLQVNPDWIKRSNLVRDSIVINELYNAFLKLPNWEPGTTDGVKTKFPYLQKIDFPYLYHCENK